MMPHRCICEICRREMPDLLEDIEPREDPQWSPEQLAKAGKYKGPPLELMRPGLRIDAGLRFHPALERASNTREGWIAEMEQAHDGEWVHISALAAVIRAQRRSVSQETK